MFLRKLLQSEFPSGGLYVLPSKNQPLVWDGVVFIRTGVFKNGIFRFVLEMESTFPIQSNPPVIKLISNILHPLVDETTSVFDTSSAFPTWSENDHIYEILKFFKYALDHVEYCCAQIQRPANAAAVDLYNSDQPKFLEIARETVARSVNEVFNSNNEDQQHAFAFDKKTVDLHEQILATMKRSDFTDSNENFSFLSVDRRG